MTTEHKLREALALLGELEKAVCECDLMRGYICRTHSLVGKVRDALTQPPTSDEGTPKRPCTCHPSDNPPQPCAEKYALSECQSASAAPQEGKADKYLIEEAQSYANHLMQTDQFQPADIVQRLIDALRTPPASTDGFVIVPRDKLEHLLEYWNGNANQLAMEDALNFILDELGALAAPQSGKKEYGWLQPYARLLRNKLRNNPWPDSDPIWQIIETWADDLCRLTAPSSPPSKAEGEA